MLVLQFFVVCLCGMAISNPERIHSTWKILIDSRRWTLVPNPELLFMRGCHTGWSQQFILFRSWATRPNLTYLHWKITGGYWWHFVWELTTFGCSNEVRSANCLGTCLNSHIHIRKEENNFRTQDQLCGFRENLQDTVVFVLSNSVCN